MARKKNAGTRKGTQDNRAREQEAPAEHKKTAQGYEDMARQAMDMWREQMGSFFAAPQNMQDFGKSFEPFTQLFTQGFDMWLMMLEQTGRMASAGGFAPTYGEKENAQRRARGAAPAGASAAAALSGASAYAVAELAARVADLEKRFDAFTRSSPAAARPATGSAKPSSSRRKGKAKIITLRPAGTHNA